MGFYRKKSEKIEAFQLKETGYFITQEWFWEAVIKDIIIIHDFGKSSLEPAWCEIMTNEGVQIANAGDYIVRDEKGNIYPCEASVFERNYVMIEQNVQKE